MQIPHDQTQGFADVRVPTQQPLEAFGGGDSTQGVFNAASRTAGIAEQIQLEKLDTALKTASDEALNSLTSKSSELKLRAQQAKGKDALAASNQALADFDKYQRDLSGSIANPTVKNIVAAHAPRFRDNLSAFTEDHAQRQMDWYEDQTHDAKIAEMQNSASVDWTPANTATAVAGQRLEIEDYGKRRGLPPEAIKIAQDVAASHTHALVIKGMIDDKQDQAAKDYFDINKGEMIGAERANAELAVNNHSKLGTAQRMVDDMFTQKYKLGENTVDEIPAIQTMDEVRRVTSKIDDAELRQEVERQAKVRLTEDKAIDKMAQETIFEQATKLMDKNPNARPETLLGSKWDELDARYRDALHARLVKERVTDDKTRVDWWAKLADPRQVAAMSFGDLNVDYLQHMSVTDAKEAYGQWEKARKEVNGDPFKPSEVKSMFTDKELVREGMASIGAGGISDADTLETIAKNSDKATALMQFERKVDNAWMSFAERNGGKITDKDRKRIVADLLQGETPVTIPLFPGEYQNPNTPDEFRRSATMTKAFKDLEEEQRKNFIIQAQNIPAPVLKDMTNFVSNLGKQVTQDKLQRMRRARLLGDDLQYMKIANE